MEKNMTTRPGLLLSHLFGPRQSLVTGKHFTLGGSTDHWTIGQWRGWRLRQWRIASINSLGTIWPAVYCRTTFWATNTINFEIFSECSFLNALKSCFREDVNWLWVGYRMSYLQLKKIYRRLSKNVQNAQFSLYWIKSFHILHKMLLLYFRFAFENPL